MRQGRARVALWLAWLLIVANGCQWSAAPSEPPKEEPYLDLSLTKASSNQEIVDEVARLEAGGWVLNSTTVSRLGRSAEQPAATEEPFTELFPAKEADRIYKSTVAVYPARDFTFSAEQLREAALLRQMSDPFLARFRRYLLSGERDFGLDLREGLLADTSFVVAVRAAHRLEAIEAAAMLDRSRLDSATDRLVNMLLIADQLDDIPHVVARLVAAELRGEASWLLEAIANHETATTNTHLRLRNLVETQLAKWPDDANLWRGDRALGLHAYEMMRSGELLSLLREEEIETLKQRGQIHTIASQLTAGVDNDQLFYLTSMRELIASCSSSRRERSQAIAAIEDRLTTLQGTAEYPYLAGEVLLTNLRTANESLAIDLAVWRAIAALLGVKVPASQATDHGIDPLTDRPFEIRDAGTRRTIELKLLEGYQRTIALDVR